MSEEDPDKTVPNPDRRALFRGLFRRAEKPDTPATAPSSPPPTQNTKPVNGFDRRKFITTSAAAITSVAGLPDSALDILNQAVGISNPSHLPMQHADEWLIGVAKTLEECWGNTARLGNLIGPLGRDECASFFYPGLICSDRKEAIMLDAEGCSELLHIAKIHAPEMANLQRLGKLGSNPLVTSVLKDAAGTAAEQLSTKFIQIRKGNMSALPEVTQPMFREISRNTSSHAESTEAEKNWQEREKKRQEAADERAWYDYVWNK